ncbi:HEXXH motif domain-containing protein [Virgisporangium ochraceum]|uniref:HEXXH motif domain-containing protein n=1 Tax=Virgisporangium ochraceum TaxID=65505 RepID=A0A8J4EF51_9ACTN|nr:HEXXH motif domain-containing protein [Virgisporangium ochraceum]GIJ72444.1 HEXXH motif domain-containing protein [Virgisporangium ochraceum]
MSHDLVHDVGLGRETPATMAALRDGQDAKRLALLRVLHLTAGRRHPDAVAASGFATAFDHLRGLPPAEIATVLRWPNVGPWLARTLHRAQHGDDDATPLWVDLGYLGWLVAAHRLTTGRGGTVRVVVRDGLVLLPGIAGLRVAGTGHGVTDLVIGDDATARPADGGAETLPLRRLTAGTVEVVLDDLDPYRDLSDPYSARQVGADPPRLTDAQARTWQEHFAAGWRLLLDRFPAYAAAMRAGLATVVPLTADPHPVGVSFTSYDAFGCVNMSAARGGAQFALALIHEFQHGKLAALTDLVRLHEPDATRHLYAPWRDDPRPLVGLLQGIYAHIGVTGFWCAMRQVDDSPTADVEFARWRAQVDRALDEVRTSPLLTPAGRVFVAAMTESMARFRDEKVPDHAATVADDSSLAHRVAWCVRNRTVDAAAVADLVDRWRAGRPPGPLPEPRLRDRLDVPREFRVDATPGFLRPEPTTPTDPTTPTGRSDDPAAWARLALTVAHVVPEPALAVLRERADVVCAVNAGLGEPADLPALLGWFAGTTGDG